MDWYISEKLAAQYAQKISNDVERQWLVQEVLQEQRGRSAIYDRALARVGKWLIQRGTSLQERHGDVCVMVLYASAQLHTTTYRRN